VTAYVNVHGHPIGVSARDAVVAIVAEAVCNKSEILAGETWVVRKSAYKYAGIIGTGANEEAAWRDAWSRMLADDVAREPLP
jgi:hypothetical protein